LPKYPVSEDIWDKIAMEKRPIAVYGMGNGADKLFSRLEKYGASVSAVFASDGFVRGHSFRGHLVKTLSDIEAEFEDFIILVSFASNRSEVIDLVKDIDGRHELYIPDMPVAGDEYFDREFYNSNYTDILKAYNALCDDDSRYLFAAAVNYKLTGKMEYLISAYSTVDEIYGILPKNIECSVDAGAYNGDTVRELISYRPSVKRIYAIEPDKRNFKKLSKYISEAELMQSVVAVNAAVWDSDTDGSFVGSGNRNSSVSSTASFENRREEIPLVRIDGISSERIDYIKYDVEGAEYEALEGSSGVISEYRPALLISAYHRSRDIFFLVNYVKERYPDYKLYMKRTLCFPAWEIAVIAAKDVR
jgi:FkbM family methyltransferase